MSESESIKSKEVVAKCRFEELAEAVDAFAGEARDVDREINEWTQRIRAGEKMYASVKVTPPSEDADVNAAVAEAEAPEKVSEEPRAEPSASEAKEEAETGSEDDSQAEPAAKEPEAVAETVRRWRYAVGADRKGPVSEEDLRRLLKSGRLPSTTLVWTKGRRDWISAAEANLVLVEEEEKEPASEEQVATRSEKDCTGCGVANREGAKFCRSCGKSLAGATVISRARKIACPSCQATVSPGVRFCRSCGGRLSS